MNVELKACAHCGHDADVRMVDWQVRGFSLGPQIRYAIDCPTGRGGCGAQTAWFRTKAEAVAAWNRRVAQEEALREAPEDRA